MRHLLSKPESVAFRVARLTRRDLLRLGLSGGAGLALGIYPALPAAAGPVFRPSAWLEIDSAGLVTIWFTKSEAGQGVITALPMLIAEELEVDWSAVKVVQAPFDPRFGDQNTGGSANVRSSWEPLRKAGAAAREMLISAGAQKLSVPRESCRAESGKVIHAASGRSVPYGALVTAAAALTPPKDVKLKDPSRFKIIGKPVHRKDTPAKVDGSATFSLDVRVPGMLYALVERCPVFGGKVVSFDSTKVQKVSGVKHVVQIPSGVAVVATSTWSAVLGRQALEVKWDEGPNAAVSSASLKSKMDEATRQAGKVVASRGSAEAAASKTVEAVYETPFMAHAALEPVNATASVTKERCEIWAPTQVPSWAFGAVQQETGLPKEAIHLNITLLGGAFGRGITPDFILEAVQVSKAVGAPVKVLRMREDDLQHDLYRPPTLHRMKGGLDATGAPASWSHHIASPSITGWLNPSAPNPEQGELGGAGDMPYAIPNVRVAYSYVPSHVPRGWVRAVEHVPNVFAVECFLDELARAAGKDPLAFRLGLLGSGAAPLGRGEQPDPARIRRVLEAAAARAGWGKPLPAREGRGIACCHGFGSYAAHVAHVAVDNDGKVTVKRVVCAFDCGTMVNPDTVAAQMEGAVVFGLTHTLKGAITIENGHVAESNFNRYGMLKMDEMPAVEVVLTPSGGALGGVGEPGVPSVAPAVCNAIFAATGKRIRALPVRTRLLRQS